MFTIHCFMWQCAQCAKMTTAITGQKTCVLRTDEKYDAKWHHWAGKR